jgi:hypothetical protein
MKAVVQKLHVLFCEAHGCWLSSASYFARTTSLAERQLHTTSSNPPSSNKCPASHCDVGCTSDGFTKRTQLVRKAGIACLL